MFGARLFGSSVLVLLAAVSVGCARERAPAPDDVDGLSRFLFTHWEDDRAMADGMSNIAIYLDGDGRSEEAQEDGFRLSALTEEEIGEGITYPSRTPIEDLVGVAVSYESPFPVEAHAALLPLQDQTWNAKQYERFDRTLIEGDADAFLAAEAPDVPELIRTDNDIVQERLGVRIPYTLRKDYRWVELDDGRVAVAGRTWAPNFGCSGDDGESGNCLELSFSIDIFIEDGPEDTLRLTSSWSKLSLVVELGEDLQVATLANGIIGIFEKTDAFIEERRGQ